MSLDEAKLELRTRAVGPWPMNSFVLVCPTTRQSVLIDPGAEPETLLEMLADTEPIEDTEQAAVLIGHHAELHAAGL